MRILLDECVNAGVRAAFPKHPVRTVAEMGWQSRKDPELLLDAERSFDVFVTIDRKIELQQDLTRFRLGFVIARVRSNLIAEFLPIFEQLREAAEKVKPGEIIQVSALSL